MPPDVEGLHRRLVETRRELIEHDAELHASRPPWGPSAYDVYDALLGLPARARTDVRFRRSALDHLDHITVDRLARDLARFVDDGGLVVRRGDSAWSNADVPDQAAAEEMLGRLNALTGRAWQGAQRDMTVLVERAGLQHPTDLHGWQQVVALLGAVERTAKLFGGADIPA